TRASATACTKAEAVFPVAATAPRNNLLDRTPLAGGRPCNKRNKCGHPVKFRCRNCRLECNASALPIVWLQPLREPAAHANDRAESRLPVNLIRRESMHTWLRKSLVVSGLALGAAVVGQNASADPSDAAHWQSVIGIIQANNVVGVGTGAVTGAPGP